MNSCALTDGSRERCPPPLSSTSTSISPPPPLGRVLHSSLLEALAYPHGVDRYVELVRPLLVKREVRAEVMSVRHQTPKSVTLTLSPKRELARDARGAVCESERRDRRRARDATILPGWLRARRDGTLELTVSTHPEGKVSRHLRQPRASGDDRGPKRGAGRVRAAAAPAHGVCC